MYHLQITTPEQVIFDEEIISLIAPGEEGYFGILTHHAPLLALLKKGVLIITLQNGKQVYYRIPTGFLEVNDNRASIIVETIETTPPIDIGIGGGI